MAKGTMKRNLEVVNIDIKACNDRINALIAKRADYYNVWNRSLMIGQDGTFIILSNRYESKIEEIENQISVQFMLLSELKRIRDGEQE